MFFRVKDTLTDEDRKKGLRAMMNDGLATQAMVIFTGGAFLVAFALKLGASNTVIGILAAIPPLLQLLQIPAVYLVEKTKNRRAITVYSSIVSRIFILLIALIPFMFGYKMGLIFLAIFLVLNSAFSAISAASWNSWIRDIVPEKNLGSYFSSRMRASTALGIFVSLAGAVYIDFWKSNFAKIEIYGYSILFFMGFLAGLAGVFFLAISPEPKLKISEDSGNFVERIIKPFKDLNFRNLLVFSGAWSFAVSLAAPFFTVYMLKRLELDMSFIIGLAVLSQIMNFMFFRVWGRFSDRIGNKAVLGLNCPLFIFSILAWTFTTLPETYFLTIPLLILIHIMMGVSLAGVNLASGNLGFKLAPRGEATSYLAARNIVFFVAAGIGPLLGGMFADFFAERELSWTLLWKSPAGEFVLPTLNLQQWDFFFMFSFIIGLYSIHKLTSIRETGQIKDKVELSEFLSETRREVRSLSTAGGMRNMFAFPFVVGKKIKKKVKKKVRKVKSKRRKE
jgi:MFS family permease